MVWFMSAWSSYCSRGKLLRKKKILSDPKLTALSVRLERCLPTVGSLGEATRSILTPCMGASIRIIAVKEKISYPRFTLFHCNFNSATGGARLPPPGDRANGQEQAEAFPPPFAPLWNWVLTADCGHLWLCTPKVLAEMIWKSKPVSVGWNLL